MMLQMGTNNGTDKNWLLGDYEGKAEKTIFSEKKYFLTSYDFSLHEKKNVS